MSHSCRTQCGLRWAEAQWPWGCLMRSSLILRVYCGGWGGGSYGGLGEGGVERLQKRERVRSCSQGHRFGSLEAQRTRLFSLNNEGVFPVERFSVGSLGGERQTFLNSQRNFSCRQVEYSKKEKKKKLEAEVLKSDPGRHYPARHSHLSALPLCSVLSYTPRAAGEGSMAPCHMVECGWRSV